MYGHTHTHAITYIRMYLVLCMNVVLHARDFQLHTDKLAENMGWFAGQIHTYIHSTFSTYVQYLKKFHE